MPDTKSRSAVARSIRYALLAVVLVVSASATTPPTNLPKIDIVYPSGGSLLDRLCQTYFKAPVDPMAVQAAAQRRPQFQAQWDAEGAAYMRAAFDEAGLAFPYAEAQVTLSVCSPASMSAPLLVDVKDFLPGATHPHPSWEFSEVVFHELMHVYVGRVVSSSRMMQKYANESPTIRFHLHVMAIEKAVLLKLDRKDELATIDREYRNGPDPAYKRAWEIVNDVEGHQVFIAELRDLPASPPGDS